MLHCNSLYMVIYILYIVYIVFYLYIDLYRADPSRLPVYHTAISNLPLSDQCNSVCHLSSTDRFSLQLTAPNAPPIPSATEIIDYISGNGMAPDWIQVRQLYPFIYLSIHIPTTLYIPVYLFMCQSVYLCIYLPVFIQGSIAEEVAITSIVGTKWMKPQVQYQIESISLARR